MEAEKRVAVFLNPFTRKIHSLKNQKKAIELLQKFKINYTDISNAGKFDININDFDECLIIGGDGTINKFINRFSECTIPVSIITAGTGNDFSRCLYGLISIDEQFNIFLNGKTVKVDTGKCNSHYFINGVGIGFDGKVVEQMNNGSNYLPGKIAYYRHLIPLVFSYKEPEFEIQIGDKSTIEKVLMITIANGKYFGGGFAITPNALSQDNLLDVCIIKEVSILKRIFNLSKIEKGRHLNLSFVNYFKLNNEIRIKTAVPTTAHIDGELIVSDNFLIQLSERKMILKI